MNLPENQTKNPVIHLRPRSSILSYPGLHRSTNEDYALAFIPENLEDYRTHGCLFIVADGTGGQGSGLEASRYAADQALKNYYGTGDFSPGDRLRMVLHDVNKDLFERTSEVDLDCGTTTLVAAVICQNILTIASVGNSRAYLIHDGQAQRITRDHDLISEILQMDTMSVEEINQAGEQNRLTRSLGQLADVEVDVFSDVPVYPGDVLLLCSDGLTRYVDDGQIALLVGTGDPMQDCRRLVNWAKRSGGEDDITALVVIIAEENESYQEITTSVKIHLEPEISPISKPRLTNGGSPQRPQPATRRWITLVLVAGGLILLALIGKGIPDRTRLFEPLGQPSKAVTPLKVSAFTATIQPQVSQAARRDMLDTPTRIVQQFGPSPSATLPGNTCVWQVGQGQSLFSIIRRFELEYSAADPYFYYEECNLEQDVCTGEKVKIESHASIYSGWFIIIPVESLEACRQGEGIWVQVPAVR